MDYRHALENFLHRSARMFAVAGLAVAVLILIGQSIAWLGLGAWPDLSVVAVLQFAGLEWASRPSAFILLHQFLAAMPLAVMVLLAGLAIAGLMKPDSEFRQDRHEVDPPPRTNNVIPFPRRHVVRHVHEADVGDWSDSA